MTENNDSISINSDREVNPSHTTSTPNNVLLAQQNFNHQHNFTSIAMNPNLNHPLSEMNFSNISSHLNRPNSSRSSVVADDSASEISEAESHNMRHLMRNNMVLQQNANNKASGDNQTITPNLVSGVNHAGPAGTNASTGVTSQMHTTGSQNTRNSERQHTSTHRKNRENRSKSYQRHNNTTPNYQNEDDRYSIKSVSSEKNIHLIENKNQMNAGLEKSGGQRVKNVSTSSTASNKRMPMTAQEEIQELRCRLTSTTQENKCLQNELEVYKLRFMQLMDENKNLKYNSQRMHRNEMRDRYEDEVINNTLLKKIQELKKEKETLVHDYENEEEFLTNDLSKKLIQLRTEKRELERSLELEQQKQVNKLLRRIDRMEKEMIEKQKNLDILKHEKVDLEQTLEKEQEEIVNRLWKKMDKLEKEKRYLQCQLGQPVSLPPSPIPDQFGKIGMAAMPNNLGVNMGGTGSAFVPNNSRNVSITDSERSGHYPMNTISHNLQSGQIMQIPAHQLQPPMLQNSSLSPLNSMRSISTSNQSINNPPNQHAGLSATNSTNSMTNPQNNPGVSPAPSLGVVNPQPMTTSVNTVVPTVSYAAHAAHLVNSNLPSVAGNCPPSISKSHYEEGERMTANIRSLKKEVETLKRQLKHNQMEFNEKVQKISIDEKTLRDENRKLIEKLKMEKERSDRLCRALSESESSLDSSWLGGADWDTYSASGMDYGYLRGYNKPRTISSPQANLVKQGKLIENQQGSIAAALAPTSHFINRPQRDHQPYPNLTPASGCYSTTSGVGISSNNPSLKGADECSVVSESGSELEKIMASSAISDRDEKSKRSNSHRASLGCISAGGLKGALISNKSHDPNTTNQANNSNNNSFNHATQTASISTGNLNTQLQQSQAAVASAANISLTSNTNTGGNANANINNNNNNHLNSSNNTLPSPSNSPANFSLNVNSNSRNSSAASPKLFCDNLDNCDEQEDSSEDPIVVMENQRTTPTNRD